MINTSSYIIDDWMNIQSKFNGGSLIIGNGASIAVDRCFDYTSLLAKAKNDGHISQQIDNIFASLGNSDFERVLSMLWDAKEVNKSLNIPESITFKSYNELKDALIKVVRSSHTTHNHMSQFMKNSFSFMKNFKMIFSLSYDLIIYWSLMEGNSATGGNLGNWFKDGFILGSTFDYNWKKLRYKQNSRGCTLIFYPHGNLSLSINNQQETYKIMAAPNKDLLDCILNEWSTLNRIPVFVSEGSSIQKMDSIRSNPYLNTVYYEAMNDMGNKIVIHGCSLADNDDHIWSKISQISSPKIAISLFTDKQTKLHQDIDRNCREIWTKVMNLNPKSDITFYDAESSGCWIY